MSTNTDRQLRSQSMLANADVRRGAETAEQVRYGIGQSHLGMTLVAVTARGICAILLGDDRARLERELRRAFPYAQLVDDTARLDHVLEKVVRFLAEPRDGLDLPLDAHGTEFQKRVWTALSEVRAGSTVNYGEVAAHIGAPKEAYAVGEACAANTIAVAIPCHRVVRKDGTLAGYRWGIKRKRALLALEAAS